jgi:hypothetical protein
MESMSNCCWCGDCHSFESLDGIQFFYLVALGVSNFVNKSVCVCVFFFHLSFYFPLVNFVSGTFLLLKPHSHKVRIGIFESTTKLYYKQNNGGFSFFFFWVLKNFDQSPPWRRDWFILYGVLCKKLGMSLLHDHSSRMVIPRPFERLFRNIYLIFKPTYFITISFITIS